MQRASLLEKELRMYWDAARELRHALLLGSPPSFIEDRIDEVEVVGTYSDSPRVKQLCAELVAKARGELQRTGHVGNHA